jgi:hypothetical protein
MLLLTWFETEYSRKHRAFLRAHFSTAREPERARPVSNIMTMKTTHTMKKVLYVDMDNVLVDFPHGIECLSDEDRAKYEGEYDECPNIFRLMRPMPGALDGYRTLAEKFDTYILSTAP